MPSELDPKTLRWAARKLQRRARYIAARRYEPTAALDTAISVEISELARELVIEARAIETKKARGE
jgi:hypothetical protein